MDVRWSGAKASHGMRPDLVFGASLCLGASVVLSRIGRDQYQVCTFVKALTEANRFDPQKANLRPN